MDSLKRLVFFCPTRTSLLATEFKPFKYLLFMKNGSIIYFKLVAIRIAFQRGGIDDDGEKTEDFVEASVK